jgi:hypothetical protein
MNVSSPIVPTVGSVATVATPDASRHLRQLCEHFERKLPVTFDPRSGRIASSLGQCSLIAGEDGLTLMLSAPDSGQLGQLQVVLARHLLRFAAREGLRIAWRPL